MNVVSFDLDFNNRYNFWSGITGGFFLALSYFGTDQSQVQRYLSGRSVTESRLGLLFNGMFKVPMQFVILLIGVLVFVFYLFTQPPIFFNAPALAAGGADRARRRVAGAAEPLRPSVRRATRGGDGVRRPRWSKRTRTQPAPRRPCGRRWRVPTALRHEAKALVAQALPHAETKDADYVFLSFVLRYVPSGLVGLLIAVILCAAMSSTASELSALGSTTTIDLYKRLFQRRESVRHDLFVSKLFTVLWGLVAVSFASFAALLDNLIQAVNILGSIFYGTVLGLFVVGFFVRRVTATPVLCAALVAQAVVVTLFFASDVGFLWYNVVGCGVVVVLAVLLELLRTPASHAAA